MMALLLTIIWLAVVSAALVGCAVIERNARLVSRPDRPELDPPRAVWGNGVEAPPARALTARALAGAARMIRAQSVVADQRPVLGILGRLGLCVSFAVILAMVPFVGTWGGGLGDEPVVLLDLRNGLAAIGFLLLLTSFSRVAIGLSERSQWSRIGSTRQASQTLAALALLTLIFAPIAISSGSLRLHDIVIQQQQSIAPAGWLAAANGGSLAESLRAWPIPAWNGITQPLTALLFLPAMSLLLGSIRVDETITGATFVAGLGIDANPVDEYWARLDERLSLIVIASLFVTLFLGAGSVPFFEPAALVARLEPYAGRMLPTLLIAAVYVGTFLAKCLLVIAVASRVKRVLAKPRVDRALRAATRRLLPIAWANLLLVAATTLWFSEFFGGDR